MLKSCTNRTFNTTFNFKAQEIDLATFKRYINCSLGFPRINRTWVSHFQAFRSIRSFIYHFTCRIISPTTYWITILKVRLISIFISNTSISFNFFIRKQRIQILVILL